MMDDKNLCFLRSERVRAKINSQIVSAQASAQQDVKIKAYPAYPVFSQRSRAGCMGGENMKFFCASPKYVKGVIMCQRAWSL